MTQPQQEKWNDLARSMAPNILLLIGMWWFSMTTTRNANVDKQEVLLESVIQRLDKIETRLDRQEQERYDRLEDQMKDIRKSLDND